MNIFKHRHFKYDIIIWAVRWYCKYGIDYRDLEEMLMERGAEVDHSTIYRWVQYYAPKITPSMRIALEDLGLDSLAVIYPGESNYKMTENIT